MSAPTTKHMEAMYKVMNFVIGSKEIGNIIRPGTWWNGDPNFEFIIGGRSDSEYATDPETRKSVSGVTVFLFQAVIYAASKMQSCVTLSVTEAEHVSMVVTVQHMLFAMRVIQSIGLKVKLPMVIECDNKGVVDLVNNWSVGGRTRHAAVKINFLRELTEQGILEARWISNTHVSSDIFTKNVG
jgi:hypothetical protein